MSHKTLNELNKASSKSIVLKRIERILEKYSDVWRTFHEPIQNSIDAIQNRDDIEEGEVTVSVNVDKQSVKISDNGRGFPENYDLLLPDGTDKDDQRETLGYQGVGLKSVIYASNHFELNAQTIDDYSWGVTIDDASKYLKSGGETEAPIKAQESKRKERGTTIEINFDGETVVNALKEIVDSVISSESNFKWKWDDVLSSNYFLDLEDNVKNFKQLLEYYFRTQTYLASVNKILNCRLKKDKEIYVKDVSIKIEFNFANFDASNLNHEVLKEFIDAVKNNGNTLDIHLDNRFLDFNLRVEKVRKNNPRNINFEIYDDIEIPPGGKTTNPILMDNVFLKILTPNYKKTEDEFEERYKEYISLIHPGDEKRRDVNKKKFSSLFPKILGIYILIGRMDYYQKFLGNQYGIKLISANGTPTQHELTARSSNQSFYFNPLNFIINVDGKLNEGKTELISNHLKRQCIEFFRESFECTLNRLTWSFVRNPPHTGRGEVTKYTDQGLEPINIDGIDLKLEPIDETSLISLFYQLLNLNDLSLPTFGLSSFDVYDGKFAYEGKTVKSDNDLKALEFKVKCLNLVKDFDNPNNSKLLAQTDLIVVWDDKLTSNQKQDWKIVNKQSVRTGKLIDADCPEWIETFIRDKNHDYKPIIILKDWVEALNQDEDE